VSDVVSDSPIDQLLKFHLGEGSLEQHNVRTSSSSQLRTRQNSIEVVESWLQDIETMPGVSHDEVREIPNNPGIKNVIETKSDQLVGEVLFYTEIIFWHPLAFHSLPCFCCGAFFIPPHLINEHSNLIFTPESCQD
jgi:hypothetical protein